MGTPVWVKRRGQPLAQGKVAYLGKVDFSDYKDWVGVQLVGASAGQGRNNSSVAGVTYFSSPPLCGLFVRQGAISVRTTAATASPMSSLKIKGRMSPRTPPSAHLKKSTKATAPLSPRTRHMNHKSTPVGLTIKIIADPVPPDETGNLPQLLNENTGEEETQQFFIQNVEEDKVVVDDFETPYQPFNILQNTESPEEEIEFDDQTGISTIESKSMHRLNLEAMFERNGVLLPPSKRKPEKKLVEERKIALENWRKQRRCKDGSGSRLPRVLENQPERKSRQQERPRSKSLAPSDALRKNATSSKKMDRSKSLTPKRETLIRRAIQAYEEECAAKSQFINEFYILCIKANVALSQLVLPRVNKDERRLCYYQSAIWTAWSFCQRCPYAQESGRTVAFRDHCIAFLYLMRDGLIIEGVELVPRDDYLALLPLRSDLKLIDAPGRKNITDTTRHITTCYRSAVNAGWSPADISIILPYSHFNAIKQTGHNHHHHN